jgi:hypothetical protein
MELADERGGEGIVYRPVSRLAVAAALAGCVASLALASQMLWVLPLVGVGLAVAGLADVARPGAEKAGRMLALAGLALSVGFGAQAVTTTVVSRWIKESRARAVAESWLDAIRGDRLADAQGMVGGEVFAADDGMMHPGHQHGDEERNAAFLKVPAVAAIHGCGPTASSLVRGTGPDATAVGSWGAVATLAPCAGGKSVDIALQLTPTVIREGVGRVERWLITKADVVP